MSNENEKASRICCLSQAWVDRCLPSDWSAAQSAMRMTIFHPAKRTFWLEKNNNFPQNPPFSLKWWLLQKCCRWKFPQLGTSYGSGYASYVTLVFPAVILSPIRIVIELPLELPYFGQHWCCWSSKFLDGNNKRSHTSWKKVYQKNRLVTTSGWSILNRFSTLYDKIFHPQKNEHRQNLLTNAHFAIFSKFVIPGWSKNCGVVGMVPKIVIHVLFPSKTLG